MPKPEENDPILESLTSDQKKAVLYFKHPLLVVAGPGIVKEITT